MSTKRNSIVIVEDNILSRVTLKKTIDKISGLHVCADFDNAEDCLNYLSSNQGADIVIMDATLPCMNGIEASILMKKYNPDIKIIITIPDNSETQVITTLLANADAYYIRDVKPNKIEEIINKISSGYISIDDRIQKALFNHIKHLPKETYIAFIDNLSSEETKFIKMSSKGFSGNDIAKYLGITLPNLNNYTYSILKKLEHVTYFSKLKQEFKYDLF